MLFRNILLALTFITSLSVQAQKVYQYQTVDGDPLKARVYTLNNGLKVYLTVYKDAPRVQTAIAVRTGSKNDPVDNTGMSHYLEHMMFKGSDEFGTRDFTKEKIYLDQIEALFEVYRKTTDTLKRNMIYHEIDSLSGIAATYAIANEYDKLLSVIGAKGTNAFTSFEETIYINDIPSVKIKPWLEIEKERFDDAVFRIFHTELETVYEEKNMSLDSDGDKVFDSLFSGLFSKHTYGTQTTLGRAEHLKNPSITALKNYYRSRYVPNNMAIVMSGDFDPDMVIRQVDETFGKLEAATVQPFTSPVEPPITKPVIKEVIGPDAESVMIGFRVGGVDTPDADMVTLINMILSNETAGLMDLNLNQAQKVLEANAFSYVLKDYSVHIFSGKAKSGQSLEEVKDLIMKQVEMVKQGDFPDWMLPAIINNIKLKEIKESQNNFYRALALTDEFIKETQPAHRIHNVERLSRISKNELVGFARKNYGDNYVVVYKRNGEAKESVRIIKPQISPVVMNRDSESEFYKNITAMPSDKIEPQFIDYKKDITHLKLKERIPVLYKQNVEDGTFNLYYYFDMGTCNSRELALALDYLPFLGTSKYSSRQLKEEFYKLACNYQINSGENEIWIALEGLSENMSGAMKLLNHIFSDIQPNKEALKNMVADLKKLREDEKLSKETILWQGMYNYGVYGEKSPFTNILNDQELDAIPAERLTDLLKGLTGYNHELLYYGPETTENLMKILDQAYYAAPAQTIPEARKFQQQENLTSKVFTVDYDMKQVEIVMLSKSSSYDKAMAPMVRLFNEYFGGSMNSVVFQEIRESKGLAYSAYAGYRNPARPELNYYLFSYIGTQNDKLPEAMKAMMGLFNNMPESEKALASSKEAIMNRIRSERITRGQVLFNYINARKFGLNEDIRKEVFEKVPGITFSDLKSFQQNYLKGKNFNIMVLGKKDQLDMKALSGYGEVKALDLKKIFGY